ncbi:ABC transporter six-transmembrane domain-containing protein [Shewanella sp. T24-MNA-CIBAN-0130]|uniref:ABC transporter six-transmembrane domain-containing protein n=1 Tax=Shewanella sp. T24-MNA-CIBAN-0130 TaxID=3140470 RepID=UPI00331779A6
MSQHILSVASLIKKDKAAIGLTWLMLALENILMALIPLFIGLSIDGLLVNDLGPLGLFAMTMAGLICVSVLRRMYDTRVYGEMKVELGKDLAPRLHGMPVSISNTRHSLARELVDFLENDLPEVFSSLIQITISVIVLVSVNALLGFASGVLLVSMLLIYGLGHGRFYRYNAGLNSQMEQQVHLLSKPSYREDRQYGAFFRHLKRLKRWEVKLSDMEAWIYGAIFLLVGLFICCNLWVGARLPVISSGQLFTIISYSWEFAEAGIALPMALQSWTRLQEISSRLNQAIQVPAKTNAANAISNKVSNEETPCL